MKKSSIVFSFPKIFLILAFLFFFPVLLPIQASPRETPVVKVVRENAQAVVNISTERIVLLRENPYWSRYGSDLDIFFGHFFGAVPRTTALKLKSVGSGVIVDTSGLIVSNAHVVHRASNLFVILNDGSSVPGRVVYENPREDIALIRIDPPRPLAQVRFGQDDDVIVGETVVAIGNPLGLENSVSSGIISGKGRDLISPQAEVVLEGLLQVDAPINPGNSGGALLNLNGELIGINVAVVQNSQSIGFAIPIKTVRAAIDSHKRNEDVTVKKASGDQEPQKTYQQQKTPDSLRDQDSFSHMTRMRQEMDKMFQGFLNRGFGHFPGGMLDSYIGYDPSLDIEEKEDEYIIRLDIRDLNQEKINIEVSSQSITISGETSGFLEEKGPQGYRQQQNFGSFLKTFPLPTDADAQAVRTQKEEGILVIILPKKK